MIFSLIASLRIQAADLPEDPARLSVLMQQSCRIQQVDRQGGAEPDHFAFCLCLDGALSQSLSPPAYPAAGLGGHIQSALGVCLGS